MSGLDWMDGALCLQVPAELFHPEPGQPTGEAMKICLACPERAACLAYALGHAVGGVWGGTTGRQRAALRRAAVAA